MDTQIWNVAMARFYALETLQEMIGRNGSRPPRLPRHRLRKLLGRVLAAAGHGLVRLGDGLASWPRSSPEPQA